MISRFPKNISQPKGGVESVTVVLAQALAKRPQIDLTLITLENGLEKPAVDVFPGFEVRRYPRPSYKFPQMFDILFGPGHSALVRYLNALHPALVHAHESWGLGLSRLPIPCLFTVHGFDDANLQANRSPHSWLRSPLWCWVQNHCLRRHKYVLSISPYVKKRIEQITQANIFEIENPVDWRFFQAVPVPSPKNILCVGWINQRKNTLGSIEAFASIANKYPDYNLIIAGEASEPDYYDSIKMRLAQLQLSHRVIFRGHISHDALLKELEQAYAFLLPSRQENSPMAIAEAMSVGVPVIVSNRCGMPYMVENGSNGFLIDPENVMDVAQRLEELLINPGLRQQMSQAAKTSAVTRFHPDMVAAKTEEAYRNILRATANPD